MGCKRCKDMLEWVDTALDAAEPVDKKKIREDLKYHLEMLHEYVR